jgi:hypothetical protein
MLDLGKGQIVLVLVSMDLRAGYYRLAEIARQALNIDVERGNTWVVYVSKRRNFAKIIHSDTKGNVMITRRLKIGAYQQLLAKATGPATQTLSKDELIKYLNGEELLVKRTNSLNHIVSVHCTSFLSP